MTRLSPDLFTRRFQGFVELGRARLHALAPEWTDYNAHDPGITLMELLAWTAEAQLYSLSRMRRDERAAYAALLGIEPEGTKPASGLVWPDFGNPGSPAATYSNTTVLPQNTTVNLSDAGGPVYRTLQDLLWVPGSIQSLSTRAGKQVTDHTAKNRRGQTVFFPFGQDSAAGKVLALSYRCNDEGGLFGSTPISARPGALWPIGVLASGDDLETDTAVTQASPFTASVVSAGERFSVAIASDASHGMLTTGVLMLDLSSLPDSPSEFTIELRAPRGLVRPPRVLRIGPNVIPIEQGQIVTNEIHVASGLPAWTFTLDLPGLRFEPGAEPIQLDIAGASDGAWQRCDDLSQLGPHDAAFEFDPVSAKVTFGNGINGRIPAPDSQVLVTYKICDGDAGNVAPNRRWIVTGLQGIYGSNSSPIAGGSNAQDLLSMQRAARSLVHTAEPLVTADDLIAAAKALPMLEVGRAWVLPPRPGAPSTGVLTLVAMRTRPDGVEPAQPPETLLWLNAIRASLSPQMPLGTRLAVIAPQYVTFAVTASLESLAGEDPQIVKADVETALRAHFELVPTSPTAQPPLPGVPVSPRDIAALIRSVDGVNRILSLRLAPVEANTGAVSVPQGALAKFDFPGSQIDVARPGKGAA